ncbi:ABC transporter substrate-binding protein [Paenibacillus sp. Soil787]|uniref:ABC transporter substrate-binding protein n=1 Tax=Paenibacillus sp. Soil787 TaxID=1736411 RepID=UPI0009EA8AD0|nr:ABC transporter substrate-binding protein [Paenibacillus sp. Soil787]
MMRKMRVLTRIMAGTLAVSTVFALSACGNSGSDKETKTTPASNTKKTTLTFWNTFTGPDGETLKSIVDKYNKDHANQVEIKMDVLPADQFAQKLPPSIATKTAPSLLLMSPSAAIPFIQNGSFQKLDDFFTASGADKGDFSDASLQMGQVNGAQYMLPMQTIGVFLFWNKKLFKEAGLDPEKPPQTFDQLAEYAVKLTDPGKNQFGLSMPVKGAPQYYTSFIWGNGGDFVDLKNKKSVLNSPENVKTMEWFQDLVVNKKVSPKGAQGSEFDKLMINGKLGMFLTGPWLAGGLKQNNIDFGVSLPPKGSVKQATLSDGSVFTIPSSTSPEEKKAAYDFIKYWNSTAIGKEWSLKIGFPPYLKSVANDPQVKADPLVSQLSNFGTAAQSFLSGLSTGDRINSDILFPMLEAIEAGQPPAIVLKKASEDIDKALQTEK